MPEVQHLTMAKHSLIRWPGLATAHLRVLKGQIWLTHAGGLDDWFLSAPQTLVVRTKQIVIEAQEDSEVACCLVQASWWGRLGMGKGLRAWQARAWPTRAACSDWGAPQTAHHSAQERLTLLSS